MQLPIVQSAPIVTEHSAAFQDLFKNCCQFQHFQNYLTGLIVLDNKTMANMTRCILDSADKTNLSRFFSETDWDVESVNKERLAYLLQKTEKHRLGARKSVLPIDDTLCEHVGSLFEYIDKHYNHGNPGYQSLCQRCGSLPSRVARVSSVRRIDAMGSICEKAFP